VAELGEAFDPSPANILTHTAHFTTKAGLETALLPKKTRNASVNAVITLRFGNEQALQNWGDPLSAAAGMLMRGTTRHSRQQLTDSLNALKSHMTTSGNGPNVTVTIQTTRDHLAAVLSLADEVLRQPAFDSVEFSQFVAAQIAAIDAQSKEPTGLALVALQNTLTRYPKSDPRYVGTAQEAIATLKSLTAAQVRQAYERFVGAGAGEVAVVGDFDPGAVRAQLDTMFAGWTSASPYTPMVTRLFTIDSARDVINTPDKANAILVAGTAFPLSDRDPQYEAMRLANYMLGGGTLTSRLTQRIRVKDGLSYATQSVFSADSRVEAGQLLALAIHAPQNRDRVIADFYSVIDSARADGFTADELAKAKTGLLQNDRLTRSQDAALAQMWVNDLLLGRTFQFEADQDARIQAATLDQVNAAFRKYVVPSKMILIWAGDDAKASTPPPIKPAP
jgi:zinc protease